MRAFREYQNKAIEWTTNIAIRETKETWCLVNAPTACGKTTIGLGILNRIASHPKFKDENLYYIVCSLLAKKQVAKEIDTLIDSGLITREVGKRIIISTAQSNEYIDGVVCFDEAHHLTEDGAWRDKLKYESRIPFLVGLTGTPRVTLKEDGFDHCLRIFRENIHEVKFPSLKLCSIEVIPNLIQLKEKFKLSELAWSRILEDKKFLPNLQFVKGVNSKFEYIVEELKRRNHEFRKAIIFTDSQYSAEELSDLLNEKGLKAGRLISAECKTEDKINTVLSAFKNNAFKYLVSCSMLNEAYDDPEVDAVILTSKTASDIRYSQWIGRGFRPFPGKTKFMLIDFWDNYESFHSNMINGNLFSGSKKSISSDFNYVQYRPETKEAYKNLIWLRKLINDQFDYFGIDTNKLDTNETFSEQQINAFLLLLAHNNPYYSDSSPSSDKVREVLFKQDGSAPLEVSFVREIVKPMIDMTLGVCCEREVTLKGGKRIDILISQNPMTILEFAMGPADEKLSQILNYHHLMQNEMKLKDFKNVIVGNSFEGNSKSRIVNSKYNVQFLNWIDFFKMFMSVIENEESLAA